MWCYLDGDTMIAKHNDGIHTQTHPGALPICSTLHTVENCIYSSSQQLWDCLLDLCKSHQTPHAKTQSFQVRRLNLSFFYPQEAVLNVGGGGVRSYRWSYRGGI